jgi:hypothetical protein
MAPNLAAAIGGAGTEATTIGAVNGDVVLDVLPPLPVGQLSDTSFRLAVTVQCRRTDAAAAPVIFDGAVLGTWDGTTLTIDGASAITKTSTAGSALTAAFRDGGTGILQVRMGGIAGQTWLYKATVVGLGSL